MIEIIIASALSLAVLLLAQSIIKLKPAGLTQRIAASDVRVEPIHRGAVESLRALGKSIRRSTNVSSDLKVIMQMPDILELISVALDSGEGIYGSFKLILPRAEGQFAAELRRVISAVELGSTFEAELERLASTSNSQQVAEFANKLRLTINRGTPVTELLVQQAQSIRHEINTRLLSQAGKNETKMLIPLVFLILPVTVLFAIYPSLQLLNLNYLGNI